MTDIVFVLQWVRDNIANFGGDPANVTIMGQSGGGAKVSILLAMPSAKGLFHRASIHSGPGLRVAEKPDSLKISAAVLAELGITASNLNQLQAITTDQLLNAGIAALHKVNGPSAGPPIGIRRLTGRTNFSPYMDGELIPRHPFDPTAPEISATVPILVGSVLNEFVNGMDKPDCFSMTDAQLMEQVAAAYDAAHAADLISAFRKGHPNANPFQLWSIMSATSIMRANSVILAQRKAALFKAPAYCFWFQWQTPVLDGRPMAYHCADLSFFFDNMERCETMTGNGPDARLLSAQMGEAWISFARTGNPNHPGIPNWAPVTPSGSETMIFDTPPSFSQDPDSEERKVLASIPA
jgi:para-nitrobenzyl esterase